MPAFLDWVNAAAIGKAIREPLRITPVFLVDGKPVPGKSLWLADAAPVRYAFPELSGLWSEGDRTERTVLPPLTGVVK
jgi:hypothetical protein